jgi:hypothetical protein
MRSVGGGVTFSPQDADKRSGLRKEQTRAQGEEPVERLHCASHVDFGIIVICSSYQLSWTFSRYLNNGRPLVEALTTPSVLVNIGASNFPRFQGTNMSVPSQLDKV